MIRGSWCSKSRLAKAVVRGSCSAETWKMARRCRRDVHFVGQNVRNTSARDQLILDVYDVKKWHAAERISKSKFTTHQHGRTDFWKCRSRKMARRLWRKAHLQVKMRKTPTWSDQFLKFRFGKMAPRCRREAHLQVKMWKNWRVGPLFNVPISKNDTPLWREAHLQVKICKTAWVLGHFWSSVSWLVS